MPIGDGYSPEFLRFYEQLCNSREHINANITITTSDTVYWGRLENILPLGSSPNIVMGVFVRLEPHVEGFPSEPTKDGQRWRDIPRSAIKTFDIDPEGKIRALKFSENKKDGNLES